MAAKPKILIYTPTAGGAESAPIKSAYHTAVLQLARNPSLDFLDLRFFVNSSDLHRVRSHASAIFLDRPEYTHLLGWDEDVAASVEQIAACLRGMIASGFDCVGATYPHKAINWARAAAWVNSQISAGLEVTPEKLEAASVDLVYRQLTYKSGTTEKGCVEVDGVPTGFFLTSRRCVEKMTEAYGDTLTFTDDVAGVSRKLVGLYLETISGKPEDPLLMHDFKFCERWQKLGERVMMYVGPGAPLNHIGSYVFRGFPLGQGSST
jgi:hypothetical protein